MNSDSGSGETNDVPLRRFLEREYPKEAERLLGYLLYAGMEEGCFCYRNRITRSLLILNISGEVQYCASDALHTIYIYKTLLPKRKYRRKERRA
ncbi:hypothetical protein D3P08_01020 [Paenibacillus nanensis]|uniref:Uncharacterized protein n=1 Tax=Paenibacillus nanensis TaxID=393251 RepID=A0A3A1VNU0_9BACL|nr:hypothetical protein [Paenibacillus nanensis]RIX60193.1 hypothetical protein D3P08_01020 [Paenibacillus nanensis]